jgi:periplasmic protein TonB
MTTADGTGCAIPLGWLASVCLHAMLAFGGLVFIQHLTLASRPNPFEWNVAIVRSLSPSSHTATPTVQGLEPAPAALAQARSSRLKRTAEPHRPPLQPSPETAHLHQESSSLSMSSSPDAGVDEPPVQSLEDVIPPAPMGFNGPDVVSSPESEPVTAPAQNQPGRITPEVSSAMRMATISPDPPSAGRPDYAWLSEAILRRMEGLKRYPAQARLDRAEGKVVLKAVLRSNGSLEDVEVAQSSGHQSLDHAAVDLIREAAPFEFPRPMQQSRMTIKIPMSYRLEH